MLKRLGYGLLSAALFIGAFFCFQWGFGQLSDVRQLDRLPLTPLSAVTRGVYTVEGTVDDNQRTITAPYSNDSVVYVRYLLEEEYTDSDGNKKTRTLESGQSATPFTLFDSSGRVTVEPGFQVGATDWTARQSYRQKSGSRIYTEYTIRQGERLQLLAYYDGQFNLSQMKYGLTTLVTHESLKTEGGDTLFTASLLISAATGLLAVGFAALLVMFGVHRYWVFVVIMTLGLFAALWTIGAVNLQKDWNNTAAIYLERSVAARASNQAQAIEDLYAMYAAVKRSANQWPDSLLFAVAEQRSFRPPSLDAATATRIENRLVDIDNSQFRQQWVVLLLAGLGTLMTAGLIYGALRAIRFKRLVEFIPTSATTGLTYGIAELFGMINVDDKTPPLASRLNQQKCVAYKFSIEEKRGSGKNAKWVTIDDGAKHTPFWLEDEQGRVLVYPKGANIVFPEKKVETKGKTRYSEYWLPPFRNVYCLGFAGIADEQADQLSIQNSDDFQFLITTQEEEEVVKSKGAAGFMLTGLALGFSLIAGTVLLSGSGSLTPLDLIKVSLIVPITLSIITAILHYNGIVFLKNRVDKTRADIDTLLQRRHDLWPQLLTTVQGFMAHEQNLLQAMVDIRNGQSASAAQPEQMHKQVAQEQKVVSAFMARIEAYPELKANRLVQTFSKQMQRTEDELALIRNGYNDSVELYNTQIEKLPDVLLAKLFGFKPAQLLERSS